MQPVSWILHDALVGRLPFLFIDVDAAVTSLVDGYFRGRPTGFPLVPASGLFLDPFGRPGPRLVGNVVSGGIE